MLRSLHMKLVLIMVLLVVSLMAIAGAFLVNSVTRFYLDNFYTQMADVFSSDPQMSRDLLVQQEGETDPVEGLRQVMDANQGALGVDGHNRNYYILDGETAKYLAGSDDEGGKNLTITPNLLTAMTKKEEGSKSDPTASYMDLAIPVERGGQSFILYIRDDRGSVQELNSRLVTLIVEALIFGLVISILLSFLLSRTMVNPIRELTKGARRVAEGDFEHVIQVESHDEIGVLTGTFNDMAQQLQATLQAIEQEQNTRREFVANVSHELRTPLTNIRSYAETLAENPDLPPDMMKSFLGVILNESDRMTHIVQDLLTLSRFDSGKSELSLSRFPFGKLLEDSYQAIRLEAQRHGHKLTLTGTEDQPEIRGDKERIQQVVMNILSNAIKYTPDGGRIRMEAGWDEEKVWLNVSDNGIGIPSEDRPRIFERFYRVDKARSRESGGTGLGLSIASEIILRHDGILSLVDREGPGTTIRMELKREGPKS